MTKFHRLALAAGALLLVGSPAAWSQESDLPPELYLGAAEAAEETPVGEEGAPADWGFPPGLALSADEVLVGDEILPSRPEGPETQAAFVDDRNNALGGRSTWPGGRVPVVFSAEGGPIPEEHKKMFFSACAGWSQKAAVRCLPRTNEPVFLTVFRGHGCFANRGYSPRSGANRMSLGQWPGRPSGECWNLRTVMHEVGHVLGLSHEHQRPDRDRYVTVHFANIPQDKQSAFMKFSGAKYSTRYDLESVMHYATGSLNGRPVLTLNRGFERYLSLVGRQNRVSALDGVLLASLYGAPGSGSRDAVPVAEEDAVEASESAADGEGPAEEPTRDIEETEKKMKEAVERERRRQQAVPAPRKPEAKKEPPPVVLP